MIHGSSVAVLTALQCIYASKHEFYLTGSRYFGNTHQDSDWDFFVQNCEDVERELLQNGFKIESISEYTGDPVLTVVYKRDDVHVQLCKHAKLKMQAQRRLLPIFTEIKPTKVVAKLLWQQAIMLYIDGCRAKKYGVEL